MILNSEPAIQVRNVTKKFRMYTEKNATLKDKLIYAGRSKYKDFVALNNISVDVPKGATVGLIGVNGSGKSTLLKLMSRILYPDSGSIRVNGRVSSLLELGAGFHPDFTGRENVFMNGALFGLSKREVQARLDEIIDFSELEGFIEQPVRSYSSGMYMRLAFSVAIAVEPEIILIDEILAVGDAPFQQKCLGKIKELKSQNKTIVMVTHDMSAITQFCDHTVWLHNSEVKREGKPILCVQDYLDCAFQQSLTKNNGAHEQASMISLEGSKGATAVDSTEEHSASKTRWGSKIGLIKKVSLETNLGNGIIRCGEGVKLKINMFSEKNLNNIVLSCRVFNELEQCCFETSTLSNNPHGNTIEGGSIEVTLEMPNFILVGGAYSVDIDVHTIEGLPYDYWKNCCSISVISELYDSGICRLEHQWIFEK